MDAPVANQQAPEQGQDRGYISTPRRDAPGEHKGEKKIRRDGDAVRHEGKQRGGEKAAICIYEYESPEFLLLCIFNQLFLKQKLSTLGPSLPWYTRKCKIILANISKSVKSK